MRFAVAPFLLGLVAACSAGGGGSSPAPSRASTPAAATSTAVTAGMSNPPGITFLVHLSDAGYLVDDAGMSLYTFDNDTGDTSTCYGQCAENWPPAVTPGLVNGGIGVTGTVDLATRTDGTHGQIRYNGDPLYYYAGDTAAGQTNGDGVGGVWHLAGLAASASPSAGPASSPGASGKPASTDCYGYYCDDY